MPIRVDYQTRRDRTDRRDRAFDKQMPAFADAYMDWSLACAEGGLFVNTSNDNLPADSGSVPIKVVDVFRELLNLYFS